MANLSQYTDSDLKSLYLQSLPDSELQQLHAQAPADPNDVIKSYGGGIERGAASMAMILPNLLNSAVAGPQELYRGIRDTAQGNPTDNSPLYQPFYSSDDALKMLPEALQPHEPQTTAGKVASLSGDLMGNALAGVSPKAILMNANKDTEAMRLGKILTDKNVPAYLSDILPEKSSYKSAADLMGDVPFAGSASRDAAQQAGLNSAIAKEMGMESNVINPPLMQKANSQSGDVFKYIGENYSIAKPETNSLINDLAAMQGKIQGLDPKSAAPLNYHINDILDKVTASGEIPGTAYADVRSDLGRLARSSSDPAVSKGAYEIQHKLDEAIAPSIAPEMQKVFSDNRGHYRNMIALEPAVTKNIKSGDIDPASLQSGVSRIFPNYEYNDPSSLAQLTQGAQLLRPALQPSSPTPMQNLVKQYGWLGDGMQAALVGGAPITAPLGRLMNPKLSASDYSADISKALGRALMALPVAQTSSEANSSGRRK